MTVLTLEEETIDLANLPSGMDDSALGVGGMAVPHPCVNWPEPLPIY